MTSPVALCRLRIMVSAGAANRAAEAMFRGMDRRAVIELMSAITSQLVPPPAPSS